MTRKSELEPGSRFAENVLLANIALQKDAESRAFESRRIDLEEQLAPVRTYQTSLLNDIFVSKKPIGPKRLPTVIGFVILGLFVGVVAAFVANSVMKARREANAQPI